MTPLPATIQYQRFSTPATAGHIPTAYTPWVPAQYVMPPHMSQVEVSGSDILSLIRISKSATLCTTVLGSINKSLVRNIESILKNKVMAFEFTDLKKAFD